MSWVVYILQCGDGSLYTGVTNDLPRRLRRHNTGRGSAYVRSRGRASMVYAERREDRSTALRREREIQSWDRQKKLALIARGIA